MLSCTAPEIRKKVTVFQLTKQKQKYHWGRKETNQEDQTMQEQGVEESNGPRHLVGENPTTLRDTKNTRIRKLYPTQKVKCVCLCVYVLPGSE